jgi:bifunctional DNase/RNase
MKQMFVCEIWSIVHTNQGNAILLRPKGLEIAVPIFIGTLELQSILLGKEGVTLPRPLTHDLFLDMLDHVNLTIKKVEVHELVDNTFRARLIITGGEYTNEKPLILDSRPSDAFALSVRKRYPIYIASVVVEQAGIPLDFFKEAIERGGDFNSSSNPNEKSDKDSGALTLMEQLEQAVAEEEYEPAAARRDYLKRLDKEKLCPHFGSATVFMKHNSSL